MHILLVNFLKLHSDLFLEMLPFTVNKDEYILRIYRQLIAYSMIEPSVRSACAVLIMRSVVVIVMVQIPECTRLCARCAVVRSAFSETANQEVISYKDKSDK